MKIFAQTTGTLVGEIVSSSFQVIAPVNVTFNNSGTAVNVGINATITSGDLVTALTLNIAIAKYVSNYVNTNYSLSTTYLDVVVVGAGLAL